MKFKLKLGFLCVPDRRSVCVLELIRILGESRSPKVWPKNLPSKPALFLNLH